MRNKKSLLNLKIDRYLTVKVGSEVAICKKYDNYA